MRNPYQLVARSLMLLLASSLILAQTALAQQPVEREPGTPSSVSLLQPTDVEAPLSDLLAPFYSETGLLTLSTDAIGTNEASGLVQVDKPAGATVMQAFLLAASTPGNVLNDGDVALEGNAINWDQEVTYALFGSGESGYADVTSIVAPIVDGAPAGLVDLEVTEPNNTFSVDGAILAVIFDDPNQTSPQTIVLAFGAQDPDGDNFAITLADAFDSSEQSIEMRLGISFGFQGSAQFSTIDVNGQRLTSSAGGQDDGVAQNGALITVGGIGDDLANPDDPNAAPQGDPIFRYDDELYTLDPFINDGDTQIEATTSNPSNDDNIFFAAFVIRGQAAIIGEDILLSPVDATNPINTDHTVTATVQDDAGDPVVSTNVDFEITSGPNAGLTAAASTNAEGKATFTYSSSVAGTDVIVASFLSSQDETIFSNEATKTWTDDDTPVADTTPPVCRGPELVQNAAGKITALTDGASDPESGIASATFTRLRNLDGYLDDGSGEIGPFAQGDVVSYSAEPSSISIRAERLDMSKGGAIVVTVTNGEGLSAECDPVVETLTAEVPQVFAVHQSYPNPFTESVTIEFETVEQAHVKLEVYDLLGRRVATLVNEELAPRRYRVEWDAREEGGQVLPSGVYLYRVQAGERSGTGRMTLVR